MIGIIADTHDNMSAIREAVEFFNSQDVEMVVHAGDLISPFTAREFKKLNSGLIAVFGNNEGEREGLKKKFSEIGTELKDLHEFEHSGRRIFLYHGTYEEIVSIAARSGLYDVVVRGHTHKAGIERNENCLIINPGECCGYLSGKRTVALLNLEKMEAEIHEI